MGIKHVVTRGFGNGTFAGTIAFVALRGFIAGDPIVAFDQDVTSYQTPAERYGTQEQYNVAHARFIRQLAQGKFNNLLNVTLTKDATETVITDARIGRSTVAICIPTTANAAAIATPYKSFSAPVQGSMTLVHANDANADKIFKVILIG